MADKKVNFKVQEESEIMFENIGDKIKMLAKVVCGIGIAGSVFGGFKLIIKAFDYEEGTLFFIGLLVMAIGTLLSWIGSFFTYGFGEIIEELASVRYYLKKIDGKMTGEEKEKRFSAYGKSTKNGDQYIYYDQKGNVSEKPTVYRVRKEEKTESSSKQAPVLQRWSCPKCYHVNRIENLFCTNCGEEK